MSPQELVALASSLSIALSQNFDLADLCTLRLFFATVTSNLSLIEFQTKSCGKSSKPAASTTSMK